MPDDLLRALFADPDLPELLIRLGCAWGVGALIGLERTFRGRPAGFRTHALVCLASALLMLLGVQPQAWLEDADAALRTDPTRVAQGIMTGVGFIGAGVIFREGLTVRGLTTAASLWITAVLGLLYGAGYFEPAVIVSLLTLATLSAFHWIEKRVPAWHYAQLTVRYDTAAVPDEATLRSRFAACRVGITQIGYRLTENGRRFEYRLVVRTRSSAGFEPLCRQLRARTTSRYSKRRPFSVSR